MQRRLLGPAYSTVANPGLSLIKTTRLDFNSIAFYPPALSDYRYITVSLDRINALPVDEDVSSSFASIIDHNTSEDGQDQPILADLPPPNSQSMVPNLDDRDRFDRPRDYGPEAPTSRPARSVDSHDAYR